MLLSAFHRSIGGLKSQCEALAETIFAKVGVGLSAQRIYQDLVEEVGFADSYESVIPGSKIRWGAGRFVVVDYVGLEPGWMDV